MTPGEGRPAAGTMGRRVVVALAVGVAAVVAAWLLTRMAYFGGHPRRLMYIAAGLALAVAALLLGALGRRQRRR